MAVLLPNLDTLAQELLPHLEHPVIALVAYGSLIEGLSNSSSDLDVLAITEDVRSLQIIEDRAVPIHVEYIPLRELEQNLADIDWLFRTRLFDFQFTIVRLRRAVVLHDPTSVASTLIERIRSYHPSEKTLAKFRYQARALYHDAIGAYKDGHHDHAVLLARLSCTILGAFRLLLADELSIGLKWQYRWIERYFANDPTGWWQEFRTVLGLPDEPSAALARQTLRSTYNMLVREYHRDDPE